MVLAQLDFCKMFLFCQYIVFLYLYGYCIKGSLSEGTASEIETGSDSENTGSTFASDEIASESLNAKENVLQNTDPKVNDLLEKFVKNAEMSINDKFIYFAAGAGSMFGVCVVMSVVTVLIGLLWERCRHSSAPNQPKQQQAPHYQSQNRPGEKLPDPFGFDNQTYDGGMWGMNDGAEDGAEIYYSLPCEEGTPTYGVPDKSKATANNEDDDDIEIEDNDVYNLDDGPKTTVTDVHATTDDYGKAADVAQHYAGHTADNDSLTAGGATWGKYQEEFAETLPSADEAISVVRATVVQKSSPSPVSKHKPPIAEKPNLEEVLSQSNEAPRSIMQSLARALEERQTMKRTQRRSQTQPEESTQNEASHYDGSQYDGSQYVASRYEDGEEMYGNMEVCQNAVSVISHQPPVRDNESAYNSQTPLCYQDDDEIYSNTDRAYDDQPLYGNINV